MVDVQCAACDGCGDSAHTECVAAYWHDAAPEEDAASSCAPCGQRGWRREAEPAALGGAMLRMPCVCALGRAQTAGYSGA